LAHSFFVFASQALKSQKSYRALVTVPSVLRQRAQTLTILGEPFTSAFTFRMFGFQALFVFLSECETLCPKETPLLQYSHFAKVTTSL